MTDKLTDLEWNELTHAIDSRHEILREREGFGESVGRQRQALIRAERKLIQNLRDGRPHSMRSTA